MQNPWLELPSFPPFIAPIDAAAVARLAPRLRGDYELRLDLLPQPWTGSIHTAEVFTLALNPGFVEADYADLGDADYREQWRLALSFQTRTPFYFLDSAFSRTGGYLWWQRRLRELIDAVGIAKVARKLMCIEHFPYKSARYTPLGVTLPSQEYSLAIVSAAIGAGKPIVIMRSERVWLESVPELRGYPYIRLKNHQNPYFSRAQMTPEQFAVLVQAFAGR